MNYRYIGHGVYSKNESTRVGTRIALVLIAAFAFAAASFLVEEEAIATFIRARFF